MDPSAKKAPESGRRSQQLYGTKSRTVMSRLWGMFHKIYFHLVDVNFLPKQAHVGSARRVAMNTGASLVPDNSLLLSTDADAVPREDSVDANLRAIASGAHFGRWAHRGK